MAISGRGAYPIISEWWRRARRTRRGLASVLNFDPNADDQTFKEDWIFPATATGYTLAADSASYTVTPTAAALKASRSLSAASASYSLTPTVVALKASRKIAATSASFTLTPTTAGLKASRNLAAASASYTLTPTDVTLTYTPAGTSYTLTAESASYAVTATDVGLSYTPTAGETDTHDGFTPAEAKAVREYLKKHKQTEKPAPAAKETAAQLERTSPQTTEPEQPAAPLAAPLSAPSEADTERLAILAEIERLNTALSGLALQRIEEARQALEDSMRARAAELATGMLILIQDHEYDEDDEDDLMLLMSI